MEEFIKQIEEKVHAYDSCLSERDGDEWLKGYVSGLLQARQYAFDILSKK